MNFSKIKARYDAMTPEERETKRLEDEAYMRKRKEEQAKEEAERAANEAEREKLIPRFGHLGNIWVKGERRRLYWNREKLASALGYDWSTYNTGNISSATLDGEEISNSEMHRVLVMLDGAYTDLVTGKNFRAQNFGGNPRGIDWETVSEKMTELYMEASK